VDSRAKGRVRPVFGSEFEGQGIVGNRRRKYLGFLGPDATTHVDHGALPLGWGQEPWRGSPDWQQPKQATPQYACGQEQRVAHGSSPAWKVMGVTGSRTAPVFQKANLAGEA